MAESVLKEKAVDKRIVRTEDNHDRREQIARESAARYDRSVAEVNKTRDSDIEKALRS